MHITFQVLLVTLATLVEVRGHGGHGGHNSNQNVMHMNQQQPTSFHDSNVVGDQQHMKEHLKEEIGNINREMTPEEMEFHYFRLHDSNNDTLLDGLEILKAMTHMVPPGSEIMPHEIQGKSTGEIEQLKKERVHQMLVGLVNVIDKLLETDDVDKDGYLTYPEYIVARRRESRNMMKAQQDMLRQAEAYRQQQANMRQQPMPTKTEI